MRTFATDLCRPQPSPPTTVKQINRFVQGTVPLSCTRAQIKPYPPSLPTLAPIPPSAPLFFASTTSSGNQLSTGDEGLCRSPSFSAAFSAAPPAFPRDRGPPAVSPRVARGWAHKIPPARRSPSIERDLSYASLVRQLDVSGRRLRSLRRANEDTGARLHELESGAVLRATRERLAERDEVRHEFCAAQCFVLRVHRLSIARSVERVRLCYLGRSSV